MYSRHLPIIRFCLWLPSKSTCQRYFCCYLCALAYCTPFPAAQVKVMDFRACFWYWDFCRSCWYVVLYMVNSNCAKWAQDMLAVSCFAKILGVRHSQSRFAKWLETRANTLRGSLGALLVPLTVAPAFLAGGIYLTLKHL